MPKALFLDRDGTINVDYGYVYEPEKFVFIDGVIELCQKAQKLGYLIIVITNQSGIARGYYTDADFQKINRYMIEEFAKRGVTVTDVFYCPELSGPRRKPECGMFLEARDKYRIDMAQSVSVGDKDRDILAARNAGVGKNFLFSNNYNQIMEGL
jgi:D-glycero-D-manno-heptose 1,7-bisphosphate phosphatase